MRWPPLLSSGIFLSFTAVASSLQLSRRSFVAPVLGGALPRTVSAIDVRGLKVEGDQTGEATRLNQIAAQKKEDEEKRRRKEKRPRA